MAVISLSQQAALLSLLDTAHAFVAYKPNCSDIPDKLNYLSPPAFRGTLNIIWTSFAVVVTCTWAVQHLSVPLPPEIRSSATDSAKPPSAPNLPLRALKALSTPEAAFLERKFRWMLLTIAAPEFVLGKAVAERWAAQESRRQSGVDGWTTMHGFFANMRGFVLRFDVDAVKMPLMPSKPDELRRSLHVLRQGVLNGEEAPYYEQDPRKAEEIEFDQFRREYRSAWHHGHRSHTGQISPSTTELKPIMDKAKGKDLNLSRVCGSDHGFQRSTKALPTKELPALIASPSSPRHHVAEPLTPVTPATLVNSPQTTSYSPTRSDTSPLLSPIYAFEPHHAAKSFSRPMPLRSATAPMSTSIKTMDHNSLTWRAAWPLNSMQIQYAQNHGLIPRSSFVPHEALKDRSKGDSFIKGFAILQITALVTQIIARSFQNLATTLLEVNVLAFAACAIVTYILLWHKPQDVKVPIYIDIPTTLTRDDIINLAARGPVATLVIKDFWLHGVSVRAQADNVFPWTPGIRLRVSFTKEPVLVSPIILGIGGGGAIFGAIHFVAWDFAFPTPVERLLWRIACTVLVFFPLLGTALYWILQQFAKKARAVDAQLNRALRPMSYVIGVVYLLARLYLLVEVFRALAYPEPSIFRQVNWPSLIPYMA